MEEICTKVPNCFSKEVKKIFHANGIRHSIVSYLMMGGVNLRTVETLPGHKDLRMTMRYSRLSPEHLREAVQTLDESLTSKEGIGENLAQLSVPSCWTAKYKG